ncbi:MAG: caspase family protein [Woeseiaceae bacterium]|nr:caspase family protein [Woeseiaceae bacterium]
MKRLTQSAAYLHRASLVAGGFALAVACAVHAQGNDETRERARIAAANMQDAVVVDCQLPGKLRRLGGMRTYLTPGRLIRTSAIACRTRGGEYTLGDLASGTLSLQRWMGPASDGDPQAQYYVARIYATGMDNVPVDYAQAAAWYAKAADQGFNEAKQELGYLYELGLGVEKDPLRALNLQREASGLGENLDYAFKIEDAQALAQNLANQLDAANAALRESQLSVSNLQEQLFASREALRSQQSEMATLMAGLEVARRNPAVPEDSERVMQLERQIDAVKAELAEKQDAIYELELQRESMRAELAEQLAGAQAAQLELREIMARTERSEGTVETLSLQLAEAQQRLIQSDEEIRMLRTAYREQSEQLAAERERMLAARARTASDAEAHIAAQQAEVAVREARIASLEGQIDKLKRQLAEAEDTSVEDRLRRDLEAFKARYESDVLALSHERDMLRQTQTASDEQLDRLYAESTQRLRARDEELAAREREIAALAAESSELRQRVAEMQSQQVQLSQQAGVMATQLNAQLASARQQVASLSMALEAERAAKATMEAELVSKQILLESELQQQGRENAEKIQLLKADVEVAQSTIKRQQLRIAALEKQADESSEQLAALKKDAVQLDIEPAAVELTAPALTVLEMARSQDESGLGRFHALLIANQDYEYLDDLTTPIRDVAEIEKLLVSRYGFSVTVLRNATDDQIMRTLHDYSNDLTEEDNLLIYYAGRGSTPDGPPDRAYWLGVDAHPELRNTWLLAEHVSAKIREIQAKRVLVVTDSCFSRRSSQSVTMAVGRGLDPERFKLLARFRSRYVLTSGANLPLNDDKGDRRHSVFAKSFLEVLRQNRNVLTGEMLSNEMISRVREKSAKPDLAVPAYSSMKDTGHEAGDFFFVPMHESILVATRSPTPDSV